MTIFKYFFPVFFLFIGSSSSLIANEYKINVNNLSYTLEFNNKDFQYKSTAYKLSLPLKECNKKIIRNIAHRLKSIIGKSIVLNEKNPFLAANYTIELLNKKRKFPLNLNMKKEISFLSNLPNRMLYIKKELSSLCKK